MTSHAARPGNAVIESPGHPAIPTTGIPCTVLFREDGRADRIVLDLPRLGLEHLHSVVTNPLLEGLNGRRITGRFGDGIEFRGVIGTGVRVGRVAAINFADGFGPVAIEGLLTEFESGHLTGLASGIDATIVFRLPYYDLPFGDSFTEVAPSEVTPTESAVSPRRVLSRARIDVAALGRAWTILTSRTPPGTTAIETELRVACTGQDLDAVIADAEVLLSLLSLGQGRFVQWTVVGVCVGGQAVGERTSSAWVARGPHGNPSHVTQRAPGELRAYLEQCAPEFHRDWGWWITTSQFYLQSALTPFLEAKLSVLFSLLERLVAFDRAGQQYPPQISRDLEAVFGTEDFSRQLHDLLQRQLPAWPRQRTTQLLAEMRRWNAGPSYVRAVCDLCARHNVPAPPKDTLQLRHDLLHGYARPVSLERLRGAFSAIDDTVALLLLRMLKYTGPVYLGTSHRRVAMSDI